MVSRYAAAVLCVVSLCSIAACSRNVERAKREYVERGDNYIKAKNVDAAIIEYRNAIQRDPRFGDAYRKLATAYLSRGDVKEALSAAVTAADLLPKSAEAQIIAGDLLLLAGRFSDASAAAKRALAVDERDVRARVLLGNATAGLKDVDSAIKEFEEAIRLDPRQSGIYTGLAALKATQGDQGEAERIFRQAIEIDPKAVSPRLALGQFYLSLARPDDAERTLKEALSVAPDDARVNVSLGIFYQASRRAAEAEPFLQKAAKADPTPRTTILLADYYIGRNRLDDARPLLSPLSADRRFGSLASLRLAGIAQVKGQSADALKIIETTLTAEPKNAIVLAAKSDILRQQKKLDEALTAADAAVAANPTSPDAHLARGRVLTAKGRAETAEQAFREVLRLNPRANSARVALASLRLRTDPSDAVMLATEATQGNPRSIEARLTLARALVQKKEYGQAQQILDELAKAAPNVAAVHAQLGNLHGRKADLARARVSFMRALELDPLQLEALEGVTAVDFGAGRQAEAIARLESALRNQPDNLGVLVTAAKAYASAKRFSDAETLLVKAIGLDPTAMNVYSLLGRVYVAQNRLDAARTQFEKVAQNQDKPVGSLTLLGMIDMLENRLTAAQQSFERVMKIDPHAAVAANNLAWIYAENGGSLDMALQLAQVAKNELPNQAEVNDTLGWVYYKKGLMPLAIDALNRSLELDPKSAEATYHLALAYEKSGDRAQSRKLLTQYLALDSTSPRSADVKRRLESAGT